MVVAPRKKLKKQKPGLVPLNVNVPEELFQRFDDFVEAVGMVKRRAVMAALELIQILPPEARDKLVSGDQAGLRDRVRIQVLPAEGVDLSPEQLAQIEKGLHQDSSKRRGKDEAGAA